LPLKKKVGSGSGVGSGSVIKKYGSGIQIRIKMKRIQNTAASKEHFVRYFLIQRFFVCLYVHTNQLKRFSPESWGYQAPKWRARGADPTCLRHSKKITNKSVDIRKKLFGV
jgi:hypothetical protein